MRGVCVSAIGALCLSALLRAASVAPVADAAMQRDAGAVRALLKTGADVNSAQGDGMTALHWAALDNDVELAKMLLYAGASVKATTRLGGYTPLLLASRNGMAAMIETLVAAGADANAATTNGTTPLMLAAAAGRTDLVTALLDLGAAVNAKERARGETPLMFAVAYGRAEVIRVLTARGADLRTTSTVVDLFAVSKEKQEEEARRRRADAAAARAAAPSKEGTPAATRAGSAAGPVKEGSEAPKDAPVAAQATPEAKDAQGGQRGASAPPKQERGAPQPPGSGSHSPAPAVATHANADEEHAEEATAAGEPGAEPGTDGAKKKPQVPGVDRQYTYEELVGAQGGLTPLLLAARQGEIDAVKALLEAGADLNQVSAGDKTSPLLIAIINGHFDLARFLLDRGADPKLASDNGVTPLYAVLNCQWAPKALYPQPRAYLQQNISHLDLMKALLDKGADPNARLKKKVWYSGYNFDLSGVDETGATPFWRAAYAADVDAMRLLVAHGADPTIRTLRVPGRPRTGDGQRDAKDVSGLPPVPVGGPAVTPLQAAAGVGYGEGFAANAHRFAPGGMLAAVKYLVEELHADVNAIDHEGNTALHHAAARGDNEMILYLVSKGANVKAVNREGKTTADMANGPVQRIQPFPETVALLEKLGAKNNHKCVSC